MEKNFRGTVLTDSEKRIIFCTNFLYVLFFFLLSAFATYETGVIKTGAHHLWIVLSCLLAIIVITLGCAMMYFKKAKYIKEYKKKYFVFLIIIFITSGFVIFDNKEYFFDMVGGRTETVTNEYYVTNSFNSLVFIGNDGRRVSIRVPDEVKKELNENELISNLFEEYFSNNKLYFHKKNINIIYYPYSGMLIQLDFIE